MNFIKKFFKAREQTRKAVNTCYDFVNSIGLNFGSIYSGGENPLTLSPIYRGVELISDSIACMPIEVKKCTKKGYETLIDSNYLDLFYKSCNYTKFNLIKLLVRDIIVKGNAFLLIVRDDKGTAVELLYLMPEDVTAFTDNKNSEVIKYKINSLNLAVEPCNIVHLFKNSSNGISGDSLFRNAVKSINLSNSTENSALNFFKSGCNLSGILTVQGQLTAQQRKDIKTAWLESYGNGGKGLAVLQGNMSYSPVQISASDSQLLESRKYNLQDLARFLGISPALIGDLSHSNFSSVEAQQNSFLLHTLLPYKKLIEEELTRKLFKSSESDLKIKLDEKELLKADKLAVASYYSTLLDKGVLSINEVRRELGYVELPNLDNHIIPYTDISQNQINKKEKDKEVED